MGLFDWLFGRKKPDPYGAGFSRSYGTPPSPAPQPARAQPQGGPVPQPLNTGAAQRTSYLSWRRRRSKEPIYRVSDQTLGGSRNPQTGEATEAGAIGNVGGNARHPDPRFDASRVASHELPALPHLDALAELIETPRNELLWLTHRPIYEIGKTHGHYRLFEVKKKSGGTRLLAAPLPRLKAVQRKLVDKLVSRLPVHGAAHGFRRGRGILSGANVHVGKDVLVCFDIKDFFPTFTFRRVSGYFRWLGYGRGIANAIALLTTAALQEGNASKDPKWKPAYSVRHPDMNRYRPELPQGAPTSPGLANAICWRMDKRLSALARKFGGDYTRYADDLTFSGGEDLARHSDNLVKLVRKIVQTEGLELNEQKTRVMRKGRQQRVTGVVVNEKTNLSRRDFDKLKAILHNCVKHGPAGQNRENHPDFKGHLQGRVAHAMHIGPERGAKLKALFDKIVW